MRVYQVGSILISMYLYGASQHGAHVCDTSRCFNGVENIFCVHLSISIGIERLEPPHLITRLLIHLSLTGGVHILQELEKSY